MDLAQAGNGCCEEGRQGARRGPRFLPGQAAGLCLVLPLGTAENGALARAPEHSRPHLSRNAGFLVLREAKTREHEGTRRKRKNHTKEKQEYQGSRNAHYAKRN